MEEKDVLDQKSPKAMERFGSPQAHPAFDQFVATISALRAPDGCPWDREQTHASIAHNMIEEAYEAVDAIEASDVAHLREELGDVLLQVVLQSQIAADAGEFTVDDVCADVNEKMVRRHPHVFGQASAQNASEVLDLWDQVKLAEKEAADRAVGRSADSTADRVVVRAVDLAADRATDQAAGQEAAKDAARGGLREGLLDGVPASFPALMQAQKISRKAVAAGFEWDALDDVWGKVREEVAELNEAYAAAPKTPDGKVDRSAQELVGAVEMEFGDVLFSLVNVARRMGIDSESALRAACGKFRSRWAYMEQAAWVQGQSIEDLTNEQQEALWKAAKALEN